MWFDAQTAGLIGGILGGVMGLCGGIIGIVAGVFGRKGRYKKFVITFSIVLIVLGAMMLPIGILALLMRQPFHVWYPFLLIGGIALVVFLPNYFVLKKVYRQAELDDTL